MKKKIFIILFTLLNFFLYSKSGNSTQLIKAGHWVYDDLESLCMECKTEFFFENQPMTIGEIKFYLKKMSYEELSENGRFLYDKVNSFLSKNDDFLPEEELRLFANIKTNPEFYYKSNSKIDWSFDYYVKDFFLTIPIIIGFSDYITIEPDFIIGKNQPSMNKDNNFTNIIYGGDQLEFNFPKFAYGAAGQAFEKWGLDFSVGKEGLQIYNTQLGSVLYNRTFETDAYCALNLYTEYLKYTLTFAQVDNTKYLYLHQINLRPFDFFKFNILEGSLLNAPFEIRYLNPFMLMHQFGSWTQYDHLLSDNEEEYYGEGRFCAYFGLMFEIIPCRNFRIYGLYAQNEILDAGGARDDKALSVPDSLGGQLGLQFNIPLGSKGLLKNYIEGLYTSPYLYVKQSPDWSLYRCRGNMQTDEDTCSWIGSPYGPDSFALLVKSEYNHSQKWKAGLSYIFSIHGENSYDSLFNQYDGKKGIYTYYPYTQYKLADDDKNEDGKKKARNKGRYMWMTGINQYKNQIKLYGEYYFTSEFALYGQGLYTIQLHDKDINHCIELTCGLEYTLFN